VSESEHSGRIERRIVQLWHQVRAGEEPVAFGAVVLVVGVIAGVFWFWAGARHSGLQAASAAPRGAATEGGATGSGVGSGEFVTTTTAAALAVHVAGAVARPGLYHLPAGSRVADALGRAGGRLPAADVDRLNLAAKLVDGQKILVTRRGEPVAAEPAGPVNGGAATDVAAAAPAEPIDLNSADLAALDSLPGVGPATARAILEERNRRGGFRSTRDLLRVPGIGEGRFARLKDHVRV
jgi:competence protein ComEA